MKRIIIIIAVVALTITSASAGTGKDKKESKDVNVNIHIDKSGTIEVNGKTYSDKDIEKWVNDHLKNLSINIESDADDSDTPKVKENHEKKDKNIQLSIKITEK